jgi:sarcosine oxidase
MRIVVVGAGCFGSWTAYHLATAGHDVTLVDAYESGNSRSSSSGETRLVRLGYGPDRLYTLWARRSLSLWLEMFEREHTPLFKKTGVLWMARANDAYVAAMLDTFTVLGIPHERFTREQLVKRWPQIDFHSIAEGVLEPDGGVLFSRRAVRLVADAAERAGARRVIAAARPQRGSGRLDALALESGETIPGDVFVFACGPWLPQVFPDLLGERMFITRQEICYIGPPAGDVRFALPAMPSWIDFGSEMYGVPDIEGRGFKISYDKHGPKFDPDSGARYATNFHEHLRGYILQRFPLLAPSPLVGFEVCPYENTSNGDFLIDRHPSQENVWIVGGGSGHGFKHGPAVGEYVARLIAGSDAAEPRFQLAAKEKTQRRSVY